MILPRPAALLLLAALTPFATLAACGDNRPASERGLDISGFVWNDVDGNGIFDEGEQPIEGSLVYLDESRDDVLDPGELSVLTNAAGFFLFEGLTAGEYLVKQDLSFGWRSSTGAAALKSAATRSMNTSKRSQIIGGNDVEELRYPFMVSVGVVFEGSYFHFCGGALISERFIVTAAHCSEGQEPEEVSVALGTLNPDEPAKVVDVRSIELHPDWQGDTTIGFDMAVWELAERVDLAGLGLNTVEMLGLDNRDLATPSLLATTIGWGVSDNPSDLLQEVHVPIVTEELCAEGYPEVRDFETQICAGANKGGLDSCQGDSGGPLLVRDPESKQWLHAGITSWGQGCALPGRPGIYGRTSAMSDWALSLMRELSSSYLVELGARSVELNFPNQATVRPLVDDIEERWSVAKLELLGVDAEGLIAVNQGFGMRFFVFADQVASSPEFECSLDQDGAGPLEADSFGCGAGINSIGVAGYPDGVFLPRLTIAGGERTQIREELIRSGTPTQVELTGTLSITDARNGDFSSTHYIDYFELTEATLGAVVLVEAESSFGLQLGVYDADLRDSSNGGGRIVVVSGGTERSLHFVPEEGKSYLIGVSSSGSQATGSYTLRILNNGTPLATDL